MEKSESRCFGEGKGKEFYAEYHDLEWGVPVHDDQHLFEMLSLEGSQAGLSWETILKRRTSYRALFHEFDPSSVAQMTDQELESVLQNPKIIRNRLKVFSVRKNAQVALKIQEEMGSLDGYFWRFVDHRPIKNSWKAKGEVPCSTPLSDQISKDLKKRGMSFVGTKIIYSFMQAVGMVNDHLESCLKADAHA